MKAHAQAVKSPVPAYRLSRAPRALEGPSRRPVRRHRRPAARPSRPEAHGVVLLRALLRRRGGTRSRADSRRRRRRHRRRVRHGPRPRRAQAGGRDQMGPVGLLEHDGMAHLRRVHVRARVREVRPRPAPRPLAREEDGAQLPRARLRRRVLGRHPRPVHALEHGEERRHDLPGHPKHPRALWIGARTDVAPPWRPAHVDGPRDDLRDHRRSS